MKPPDWIPARSTTAKRKPAAEYGKDLGAGRLGDRPDQLVLGHLDPRDLAVVAHPQIGEPQSPQAASA